MAGELDFAGENESGLQLGFPNGVFGRTLRLLLLFGGDFFFGKRNDFQVFLLVHALLQGVLGDVAGVPGRYGVLLTEVLTHRLIHYLNFEFLFKRPPNCNAFLLILIASRLH